VSRSDGPALVTGASGFIGRHLVRALLAQNRPVFAFCRQPGDLRGEENPLLKVVAGDLAEPRSYEPLLSATGTIFHLAGVRAGFRSAPGSPDSLSRRINVDATLALGRGATAAGTGRFVYVSSALVFGPSGDKPRTEDDGYCRDALDAYVRSRVEALEAMEKLVEDGLPLVTVCPTIVFGPDHPSHPNRVTNYVRGLLRSRADFVIDGGQARRSVVYVTDVVRGILLAERLGAVGDGYILGAEDISHRELIRTVRSLGTRSARLSLSIPVRMALTVARLGDRIRGYDRGSGYEAAVRTLSREWRYSAQKAERDLGYRPMPVREGLRRVLRFLDEAR
jgi:nucleoside-diphosphate-sugar epimerase